MGFESILGLVGGLLGLGGSIFGGQSQQKTQKMANESAAQQLLAQKQFNEGQLKNQQDNLAFQKEQWAAQQAQGQGGMSTSPIMNTTSTTSNAVENTIPGASQLLGGGTNQANTYTWA